MIQGAKKSWASSKKYGKTSFFRLQSGAYFKANRIKYSFTYKVEVRYDSGFFEVKKKFLKFLAKDPEVEAVFKY